MTDTYQMAIGSYALALSESSKVNKLLNKLDEKAIDKGTDLRFYVSYICVLSKNLKK